MPVRPKKHLGQHFLVDQHIAKKIVDALSFQSYRAVLEVGPGTGVLTQFLIQKKIPLHVVEIDRESVTYLEENYPELSGKILKRDVLTLNLNDRELWSGDRKGAVIGNFPYNISSQIVFKILEYRNQVPEMIGMFQKEVAERINATHGNKTYGILSVLVQAFYEVEYLFTVHEHSFSPAPKVKSAVIRLKKKDQDSLVCDEQLFFKVVKTAFNQRRKTLRNALKPLLQDQKLSEINKMLFQNRAEQLSVQDFIELTQLIQAGIEPE